MIDSIDVFCTETVYSTVPPGSGMGLGSATFVSTKVGSTLVTGTVRPPWPLAGSPSSSMPEARKTSVVESPRIAADGARERARELLRRAAAGMAELTAPPPASSQARSAGTKGAPPSMASVSDCTVTGSVDTDVLVMVAV